MQRFPHLTPEPSTWRGGMVSLILLGISQVCSDWDKVPFVLTVDKPFLLNHRNQLLLLVSRPTHFCLKSPAHYILSASPWSLAPWSQFSRGMGPGKRWVVLLILPLANVPTLRRVRKTPPGYERQPPGSQAPGTRWNCGPTQKHPVCSFPDALWAPFAETRLTRTPA